MTPLPDNIQSFILDHHVLSLATIDQDGVWAASCFYAFDPAQNGLLILSSTLTRHGQAMVQHPHVAATISGQPTAWRDICGVQFSATVRLLNGQEHNTALKHYVRRHPLARLTPSDLWQLRLDTVKLTENSRLFGQKTLWRRDDKAPSS